MFRVNDDFKLQSYYRLEDFLGKKNLKKINRWKTRFFVFRNRGLFLCYFSKQVESTTDFPLGVLNVLDIVSVTVRGKREFTIKYFNKEFTLRALNGVVRAQWMEAIQVLKDHYSNSAKETLRGKFWKTKNLPADLLNLIQTENEKMLINLGRLQNPNLDMYTIIRAKGLEEFFQKIPKEYLSKRICCGWLFKQSGQITPDLINETYEQLGSVIDKVPIMNIGKKLLLPNSLNIYKRFWFFMISARPIGENSTTDDYLLEENKLPTWLEFDTVYYFDYTGPTDNSPFRTSIPAKDILNVSIIQGETLKDGFNFKVDLGEKLYLLNSKYITVVNNWIAAIKMAQRYQEEAERTKFGKIRVNADYVKNIYDQDVRGFFFLGNGKFRGKQEEVGIATHILMKVTESKQKFNLAQIHNIENQIRYFKTMGDNLVYSIDVLQAYQTPLSEIMNLYIKYYHGNLVASMKVFWKENMHLVTATEILEILTWISDYYSKLQSFGVTDDRFPQAMEVLSKVFSKKLLKNSVDLVYNCIQLEKNSSIEKDEETDVLITRAPSDFFKILSESLALIKICRQKDLGLQVLKTCFIYINVFQDEYIAEISADQFDMPHLYSTCNNIMQYIAQAKEFKEAAIELIRDVTEEEVEEIMSNAMILHSFNRIGTEAYNKLCQLFFSEIERNFLQFFTLIDVDLLLKDLWTNYSEQIMGLQTLYQKKVLKYLVDKIVFIYMQKAMADSGKFQTKMMEKVVEKIVKDKEKIKSFFKEILKTGLNESVDKMDALVGFWTADFKDMRSHIMTLRTIYGPMFVDIVVKAMLTPRTFSKQEKELIVGKILRQVIEEIEEEKMKQDVLKIKWEQEIEVAKEEEAKRKNEVFLSRSNTMRSETVKFQKYSKEKLSKLESYLLRKPETLIEGMDLNLINTLSTAAHLGYMKQYFSIKKCVFYIYKSEKSRQPLKHFSLKTAENFRIGKDFKFSFECAGKNHDFQAEDEEMQELWVEALKYNAELAKGNIKRDLNYKYVMLYDKKDGIIFEDLESSYMHKKKTERSAANLNPNDNSERERLQALEKDKTYTLSSKRAYSMTSSDEIRSDFEKLSGGGVAFEMKNMAVYKDEPPVSKNIQKKSLFNDVLGKIGVNQKIVLPNEGKTKMNVYA